MRYGPGVPDASPPGQPRLTAERAGRGGRGSHAKPPAARDRRLSRMLGWTLTAALLAASGVVLYLRFHASPFHVTSARISGQTRGGCGVDVTGRITTNGAAGTVSYQWVFRPDPHQPQPLSQSVTAGQRALYVTVEVEGAGQGTASQQVTLQVLGPDPASASATVVVTCLQHPESA
jgi:hypothetical protein